MSDGHTATLRPRREPPPAGKLEALPAGADSGASGPIRLVRAPGAQSHGEHTDYNRDWSAAAIDRESG